MPSKRTDRLEERRRKELDDMLRELPQPLDVDEDEDEDEFSKATPSVPVTGTN